VGVRQPSAGGEKRRAVKAGKRDVAHPAKIKPGERSSASAGGVRFMNPSAGSTNTVSWTPGSASWSFTSDSNAKEGVVPVDGKSVLDKLARLLISEWNYRGYAERHIGPTAQDFHAHFPLNDSETTLNDADLHGVALAAIQGLNQKVEAQRAELKQKQTEIAGLKHELGELKQLVQQLAAQLDAGK
jgi:hypothetical protein